MKTFRFLKIQPEILKHSLFYYSVYGTQYSLIQNTVALGFQGAGKASCHVPYAKLLVKPVSRSPPALAPDSPSHRLFYNNLTGTSTVRQQNNRCVVCAGQALRRAGCQLDARCTRGTARLALTRLWGTWGLLGSPKAPKCLLGQASRLSWRGWDSSVALPE